MDVKDIIIRDRFLRTLEQHYAMNIVYAMASTIQGALNRLKPDVIFSIMPDNYIMDIFERLQTRCKKISHCTVMSLLNGYFRITRRGELLKCRNVFKKKRCQVPLICWNFLKIIGPGNTKWLSSHQNFSANYKSI